MEEQGQCAVRKSKTIFKSIQSTFSLLDRWLTRWFSKRNRYLHWARWHRSERWRSKTGNRPIFLRSPDCAGKSFGLVFLFTGENMLSCFRIFSAGRPPGRGVLFIGNELKSRGNRHRPATQRKMGKSNWKEVDPWLWLSMQKLIWRKKKRKTKYDSGEWPTKPSSSLFSARVSDCWCVAAFYVKLGSQRGRW